MNADDEVMRNFPQTLTSAESDSFVERIEAGFEANGFGLWVVDFDGQFAGFTGLNRPSFVTPMGPHVEIGWRLARWAWGRGFASEAARCVLEAAFNVFEISEVFSYTTPSNFRSEAVMRRVGMVRRPDLDFDHPNTPGWWGRRHIVYSVIQPDS